MVTIRVLVTGSRSWDEVTYLESVFTLVDSMIGPDAHKVLVSGNCPSGADRLAEEAVVKLGWELELHPADWDKHGRRAGFVRNSEMVNSEPDFVIAFVKDKSKGATMTVNLARKAGLPVEEHIQELGDRAIRVVRTGFDDTDTPPEGEATLW